MGHFEELSKAWQKQTTNYEGLQAKFFKYGMDLLVSPITYFFNEIDFSMSHASWSQHIIHSIHKSKGISNLNNYRTIMIRHRLVELYNIALCMMFFEQLENGNHRTRGKSSFKTNFQTNIVCHSLMHNILQAIGAWQ